MISAASALLLALAACVNGPVNLYGTGGNECTEEQIRAGCWIDSVDHQEHECSQAIEHGESTGATYYQYWRCVEGTQTCCLFNNARFNNWAWLDDAHSTWGPQRNIRFYYPDWDESSLCGPPDEGVWYTYQVKGCNGHGNCSPDWSASILYKGIKRWCYIGGPMGYRYVCSDRTQSPIARGAP